MAAFGRGTFRRRGALRIRSHGPPPLAPFRHADAVARTAGTVAGRFVPLIADMAAMFRWFETGRYVADPRRQEQLFGPVPAAEETLARYTDELRTTQHR